MTNNQTVRVRRMDVEKFLTCPICNQIIDNPMNITECLHIFCNECIVQKITEEDLYSCPVCKVDLGSYPLEKLRPDHNWRAIRASIVPSVREDSEDSEVVKREGDEVDFINAEAEESEAPFFELPARRKDRSLSSLVSPPKVSDHTPTTRRTKPNARRVGPQESIEKPHKLEDYPESSSSGLSMTLGKLHTIISSYSMGDSSKQQIPTKSTEKVQRNGKSLDGMNELLKPLNCLAEATEMTKSDAERLFGKSTNMANGKGKDSGNKSNYDDNDDTIGFTPPSVPVKTKRMSRGRPRKTPASAPAPTHVEMNVTPQAVIDTASNQNVKRVVPIWLSLMASENQEGDARLPQIPSPFLRIKDGTMPVSFVKKYLVQKLELHSEDEVEIYFWGERLLPSLELSTVIEVWSQTTSPAEKFSAMVGDSAKEFVMVLSYAGKALLS